METKMSLKLLVDKNKNQVLFAESGKDFVDFLFGLLSLPLATIVRLLTPTHSTTGSVGNLYSSLDKLDNLYMRPNVDKSLLLQPKMGSCGTETQMLLMQSDCERGNGKSQSTPMKPSYYRCSFCNSNRYVTNVFGASCGTCKSSMGTEVFFVEGREGQQGSNPFRMRGYYRCGFCSSFSYVTNVFQASCGNCRNNMTAEVIFVRGQQGSTVGSGSGSGSGVGGGGGYVKEVVTYMIADDLEVKPMSTISTITILNKCDVKDVGALEERVVHVGRKEGLDLLSASLQSNSVLTDVFLGRKPVKVEPCSSTKTYPPTQ